MRQCKVVCMVCGKQVVQGSKPARDDRHCTTAEGARAGFGSKVFCGYCAENMDENGLFPEERAQLEQTQEE